MKDKEVIDQVEQFSNEWQTITVAYSDYARSVDITYTELQILKYITRIENCTQKIICELSYLPRQTVNSIITGFYKKGFVELQELPEDRRIKSIRLTKKGQSYVDSIFPNIDDAEYYAMSSLNNEQRAMLIESIRLYSSFFRERIFQNKRDDA